MNSISLQFDRPWVFFALIPAFALILIPFLRLPKVRKKSFKRIAPVVLHCIVATILIILLAGTTFVKTSYEQQVMILLDLSDSTEPVQDEIKEKADTLLALLEDKATVGIMAFADNSLYEVKADSVSDLSLKKLDTDATDISSALNTAASTFTGEKAARIIILSDGRQTVNDASATAFLLNNNNVKIDAMYFDSSNSDAAEVQITSVTSSGDGYAGDEITLTIEITSNVSEAASLTLYDNDTEYESIDITANEGTSIVTLSLSDITAGTHTFYIELTAADDTITKNNSAYAYVNIAGRSSVLIICDRLTEAVSLSSLLEETCTVTTVTAKNAPDTIIELCDYDEVILLNVDNDDLPKGFSALADTYVSDYGRSLLTVGGKGTMMYGNMEGTEFADLLPVDMTLEETGEGNSVAIMLVIDASSSMQSSNYMTLAKEGAISCIESLTDADYAGVISFSSTATLEQSLTQTTEKNKEILSRTISGIVNSRGTYYTKALQLAYNELKDCDADVKYVMFLSDGNPQDTGYLSTVKSMAADGIIVSTIGIGGTYNALNQMATSGNGRYYAVTNAKDLPDIMLSETEQVTVSSYITGEFNVVINTTSDLTNAVSEDDIPILTGYLGTTLKDGATAYLETTEGHPVYASWQYGSGISAVFTSDLSGTWSADWFETDTGKYLIQKIIETSVGSAHHDSSMEITYTRYGDTVKVSVASTGEVDSGVMNFSVSNGTTVDTSVLSLTASGTYEGYFNLSGAGIYETITTLTDADGNVEDFLTSAYAALYSEEYNAFGSSGKGTLEAAVSYSGGKVTDDLTYLSDVSNASITDITDPFILLSILAAVLFLIDIAIRKIRWKDLVSNFKRSA